jgi:cytochrome c oxidase subunit II
MPSSLDPNGPVAANIVELWWLMFFLGTAVFVLVLGVMLLGLFRRRDAGQADERDVERRGERWIILGGIVLPAIVLAIVFGFTVRSSALTANAESPDALTIEVVGRRWWWEVNYPDEGIVTANEIHIPVGKTVELVLTSGDVIHSFWVPQLGGKMDMIPGRTNRMTLRADQAGEFRGECAEFCGLQHARMHFLMIAQPPEEFEQWAEAQRTAANEPEDERAIRGQAVFIAAGCVYCHTIRGLDGADLDRSSVDLGPDLTHLAGRRTIAAGMRGNNRGNLAGWIADPHSIKRGALMPATLLAGEDLQALLDYLESLE